MITTHVLDLARGVAGSGMTVTLEHHRAGEWARIATGQTDRDGRLTTLTDGQALPSGTYRLTFDIAAYQRRHGVADPFFPHAQVAFHVSQTPGHIHVPLLLSPFGYTAYRGS